MNTNKILIAGVLGGVFSFLFGWLIFGILFKDAMPNNVPGFMKSEEEMIMWAMAVSNLIFGLFMAYIFVQWASISTWQGGGKAGAILGCFITASYDFGFFGMSNMFGSLTQVIIDIALNVVMTAITGAVIGWWLGRK